MSDYSTYIGLDVHARSVTCQAKIVDPSHPKAGVKMSKRFSDCPSAEVISEWMLAFPQPVYCAYESGCTGFKLARDLRDIGIVCDVIAVSTLPKSDKAKKAKHDKLDAQAILSAIMNPEPEHTVVWIPDSETEAARDLARMQLDAVEALKASKQQLLALLLRYGYVWNEKTPTGNLKYKWSSDFMKWLRSIKLGDEAAQITLNFYIDLVERNKELVEKARELVAKEAEKERWKPYVDALKRLKGVDTCGAFLAAAEFGDFSRFESGRKVSCWLGTVPKNNSSGDKEKHGGITKSGNSHLRRILVEGNASISLRGSGTKKLSKGQVVSEEVERMARKANARLLKRYNHLVGECGKHANKAKMAVVNEQVRWMWIIGKTVQDELAAKNGGKPLSA